MSNILDARNLMIDRRHIAHESRDFRDLNTVILFAVEDALNVACGDMRRIHDWHWCLKGTRGYRSRVHPL